MARLRARCKRQWQIGMFEPIPAPGFKLISGKRSPPNDGTEYHIQLRTGFADMANTYTCRQLVWIHDGSGGDVVAIKVKE